MRGKLLAKVAAAVEARHWNPGFDREAWRASLERRRAELLAAPMKRFETGLDELVRSVGTPDSGFFHQSARPKRLKGLAARFQHCRPNECSPALTSPSEAGYVMTSRPAD